jgi:superfamily II DNA/RNA helicase
MRVLIVVLLLVWLETLQGFDLRCAQWTRHVKRPNTRHALANEVAGPSLTEIAVNTLLKKKDKKMRQRPEFADIQPNNVANKIKKRRPPMEFVPESKSTSSTGFSSAPAPTTRNGKPDRHAELDDMSIEELEEYLDKKFGGKKFSEEDEDEYSIVDDDNNEVDAATSPNKHVVGLHASKATKHNRARSKADHVKKSFFPHFDATRAMHEEWKQMERTTGDAEHADNQERTFRLRPPSEEREAARKLQEDRLQFLAQEREEKKMAKRKALQELSRQEFRPFKFAMENRADDDDVTTDASIHAPSPTASIFNFEESLESLLSSMESLRNDDELRLTVMRNLHSMGISTPTKIQSLTVPAIAVARNHSLLMAQTGSGKTLAYLLPLLQLLHPDRSNVQAVVLAPSRELVLQIHRVAATLFRGTNFRSLPLIGGANIRLQLDQLREQRPHVLIATPGRFAELVFKYEKVHLKGLRALVLDEVDQLLQDSFREEIYTIAEATPLVRQAPAPAPARRRVDDDNIHDVIEMNHTATNASSNANVAGKRPMLLIAASATAIADPAVPLFMTKFCSSPPFGSSSSSSSSSSSRDIPSVNDATTSTTITSTTTSKSFMTKLHHHSSSPSWSLVHIAQAAAVPTSLTHAVVVCARIKMLENLKRLLTVLHTSTEDHHHTFRRCLIFVNDAHRVEVVARKLFEDSRGRLVAAPLHGDSSKDDRKEVLARLLDGRLQYVVTTELAARGLDIPDLSHVINLDLPSDSAHYVHRVGRCGRAGRAGMVVNFATSSTKFVLRRFAKQLSVKMNDAEVRNGQVYLRKV